eukprot:m.38430 g.38430  ORF g.38430 m.38430 type:complete len:199 (-) comp5663_c0_seq1:208-804(-)
MSGTMLVTWAAMMALGECRQGEKAPSVVTGTLGLVGMSPDDGGCTLPSLFPDVDSDGDCTADACFFAFSVVTNYNESMMTIELDSANISCTCPKGVSAEVNSSLTAIDISFNESVVLELTKANGTVTLGTPACVAAYRVTSGTFLGISAESSQSGKPGSVELFAVLLLLISAFGILVVFIGSCRSQSRGGSHYQALDG